jgi:hypothetical protein
MNPDDSIITEWDEDAEDFLPVEDKPLEEAVDTILDSKPPDSTPPEQDA